jgi:L-lactate dehydrogenase complex protein LldG
MYEQFKARAEGVSAEVYRCETTALAIDFVIGFLQQEGLADEPHAHAVWADAPFLAGIDRQPLMAIAGLKFEVTRELAAEARFGISQMGWALADTGTLAQDSTAIEQRLVSSLPTIHIAIVPTIGLLPDMPTLLTRINPAQSGYIAMITGPSRTADIERVLTIGVHGPERLVIVFVDEL